MPPQILIKRICLIILSFPDLIKKSIVRIKIKETSAGINGEENSKAAKIRIKKIKQMDFKIDILNQFNNITI